MGQIKCTRRNYHPGVCMLYVATMKATVSLLLLATMNNDL